MNPFKTFTTLVKSGMVELVSKDRILAIRAKKGKFVFQLDGDINDIVLNKEKAFKKLEMYFNKGFKLARL